MNHLFELLVFIFTTKNRSKKKNPKQKPSKPTKAPTRSTYGELILGFRRLEAKNNVVKK